jgi:hypothetical protein
VAVLALIYFSILGQCETNREFVGLLILPLFTILNEAGTLMSSSI